MAQNHGGANDGPAWRPVNKPRGTRIGGSGLQVGALGLGCAPLGNLYRPVEEAEAAEILTSAWGHGIRLFDTAPHYGQGLSERRVGDALRRASRRDYVLSTKVGRLLVPAGYAEERHGFASPMPFDRVHDYSYGGVMRSFQDSLQRLGLDRIDILFMHDIGRATHGERNDELFPVAMQDGYRAMAELRRNGDVRAIGVGANEIEACAMALDRGDWDCFLLAGRYTLLEQEALQSFLPACGARHCSVVVGGPYNSGILATGVRGAETGYYNYRPAPLDIIDRVERLEAACAEYAIPLAAAALQFPLAHPAVASVVPGIDSAVRVAQTMRLLATPIPDDFWRALRSRGLLAENAPTPRLDCAG